MYLVDQVDGFLIMDLIIKGIEKYHMNLMHGNHYRIHT